MSAYFNKTIVDVEYQKYTLHNIGSVYNEKLKIALCMKHNVEIPLRKYMISHDRNKYVLFYASILLLLNLSFKIKRLQFRCMNMYFQMGSQNQIPLYEGIDNLTSHITSIRMISTHISSLARSISHFSEKDWLHAA